MARAIPAQLMFVQMKCVELKMRARKNPVEQTLVVHHTCVQMTFARNPTPVSSRKIAVVTIVLQTHVLQTHVAQKTALQRNVPQINAT
ncbi:hypothetical protein DRN52_05085 [Thermococci archaeon]|nr:MAG: hypothetical protein DRN52_05085 [Thermococci archaeon]